MKHLKHLKYAFCNMREVGQSNLAVRVEADDERQCTSTTSGASTTTSSATITGLGSDRWAARATSGASTTSISASCGARAPLVERKDGGRRATTTLEQSRHTAVVLGV
jgi:hypothetical protein